MHAPFAPPCCLRVRLEHCQRARQKCRQQAGWGFTCFTPACANSSLSLRLLAILSADRCIQLQNRGHRRIQARPQKHNASQENEAEERLGGLSKKLFYFS